MRQHARLGGRVLVAAVDLPANCEVLREEPLMAVNQLGGGQMLSQLNQLSEQLSEQQLGEQQLSEQQLSDQTNTTTAEVVDSLGGVDCQREVFHQYVQLFLLFARSSTDTCPPPQQCLFSAKSSTPSSSLPPPPSPSSIAAAKSTFLSLFYAGEDISFSRTTEQRVSDYCRWRSPGQCRCELPHDLLCSLAACWDLNAYQTSLRVATTGDGGTTGGGATTGGGGTAGLCGGEEGDRGGGGETLCRGSGLFYLISKIPHSCAPNVRIAVTSPNRFELPADTTVGSTTIDDQEFCCGGSRVCCCVGRVVTTRSVSAGEVLASWYPEDVDLWWADARTRRKYLKKQRGFVCNCPRCFYCLDSGPVGGTTTDEPVVCAANYELLLGGEVGSGGGGGVRSFDDIGRVFQCPHCCQQTTEGGGGGLCSTSSSIMWRCSECGQQCDAALLPIAAERRICRKLFFSDLQERVELEEGDRIVADLDELSDVIVETLGHRHWTFAYIHKLLSDGYYHRDTCLSVAHSLSVLDWFNNSLFFAPIITSSCKKLLLHELPGYVTRPLLLLVWRALDACIDKIPHQTTPEETTRGGGDNGERKQHVGGAGLSTTTGVVDARVLIVRLCRLLMDVRGAEQFSGGGESCSEWKKKRDVEKEEWKVVRGTANNSEGLRGLWHRSSEGSVSQVVRFAELYEQQIKTSCAKCGRTTRIVDTEETKCNNVVGTEAISSGGCTTSVPSNTTSLGNAPTAAAACGECGEVVYCSSACQLADRTSHKKGCWRPQSLFLDMASSLLGG
eukprot:GHVS01007983.1.p1 GENE.GHVS01007983.1~~GHVS01007983.1.p1  ORF type:complete len:808 (-),score=230.82 GHVS01007983.1:203-2554(-)